MQKMKRLTAMMLAIATCLSLSVSAFAAPSEAVESQQAAVILDEATKLAYHAEYQKIAEEVNEELNAYISVNPMEDFAENEWVTPEEFREIITAIASWNIVCTDTAMSARSMSSATKTDTIEISGKSYTIAITGRFSTMLVNSRQVFDGIDTITSEADSSVGTWTQTGYESALLDQRRTYSITVSGTFVVAGATFRNMLAEADFYCGATGVVS